MLRRVNIPKDRQGRKSRGGRGWDVPPPPLIDWVGQYFPSWPSGPKKIDHLILINNMILNTIFWKTVKTHIDILNDKKTQLMTHFWKVVQVSINFHFKKFFALHAIEGSRFREPLLIAPWTYDWTPSLETDCAPAKGSIFRKVSLLILIILVKFNNFCKAFVMIDNVNTNYWNFLHIASTHATLLTFLFEDFAISNLLSLYVEHLGKQCGLSFGDPKLLVINR
jgi:hypothetical protein